MTRLTPLDKTDFKLTCWKCEGMTVHTCERTLVEDTNEISYYVSCNECDTYEEFLEPPEAKELRTEVEKLKKERVQAKNEKH